MKLDRGYLEDIKKRREESKVYKEFQLTGLLLADLLGDRSHKSLYIRLAKDGDKSLLLRLAKDVSSRKGIKNKGAYFMKVWQKEKPKKSRKKIDPSIY